MSDVAIRQAKGPDDLSVVRDLCWAYRDILIARTADVPNLLEHYYDNDTYTALMADLPVFHATPDGAIFVAEHDNQIVGCGMTHRINATNCEIKRVYVVPEARGLGVARKLCAAAMEWAHRAGYDRMVLDTMRRLPEAITLYESMGFTPTPAYHVLPPEFADMVLFFEHPL